LVYKAQNLKYFTILILFLGIMPIATAHTRITTDINWSNEIRAIFAEKCMTCHHPGGMAPDFVDLSVYGTDTDPGARAWAIAVEEEIMMDRMPPWKPDHRFNEFSNAKRLTEEEKFMILAWIRGGSPQGPLRNLPIPEKFQKPQFQFGEPDLLFEFSKPFAFSDEDSDAFATETFEVELEEDTYMTGYEFVAENPRQMHSMTAWLIPPDEEATIDVEIKKPFDPLAEEEELEEVYQRPLPQRQQLLGQWARGDQPVLLPDAAGRLLRKGSKLKLNIQYVRTDFDLWEAINDHSKLGLFLAGETEEIDLLVESDALTQPAFTVPAENNNFKAVQEFNVEEAMHLLGINPMLGPLGKNLEVIATYPDGRSKTLMWIPEYKQLWDSSYQFAEPIAAPVGTTVQVIAHYDNTADNWANPNDPPVDVKSGRGFKAARLRTTIDYMLDTHLNVEVEFVPPPEAENEQRGEMFAGNPLNIDLGNSEIDEKDPVTDVAEFNRRVLEAAGESEKVTGALDVASGIYWCPMRGNPCVRKDYKKGDLCDDCFMDVTPKEDAYKGKEKAPYTNPWELSKLGKSSTYWCPDRRKSDHPLKDYAAPGTCDVDGETLLHKSQFKVVRTFTCTTPDCDKRGVLHYGPGLCHDCGEPVAGMGHMDHTPKNGGWQIFMAPNLYHHLEGTVHEAGEFKLYIYDDWKEDLDARSVSGNMYTLETDEATGKVTAIEHPLYVKKEGNTWLTADVPMEFPYSFYVRVWLSGKEEQFNFEFEELTPRPDPNAVQGDYPVHGHNCPPIVIPETLSGILAALKDQEARLKMAVEQEIWLGLHCPAVESDKLTIALGKHLSGLNVRQRGKYQKIKIQMGVDALRLDTAGDANDAPRVQRAFERYNKTMADLREIFPDLK